MSVGTDQLQCTYRVTFTYHYFPNQITPTAFNTVNLLPTMFFRSVDLTTYS
jgi:hypothetical protein